MTDEFFEDENVDDGENNLEYDRDIFDIEIEFDDEVVKKIERTEATREFEKLIENGFDEQKLQFETLNKDELVDIVQFAKERNSDLEYSDDVSQNVRYQLAKRLYGYEGTNSAEELMAFFSEDK